MPKRLAWILLLAPFALAAYLAWWPVPIRVAWRRLRPRICRTACRQPATGGLQVIALGGEEGPGTRRLRPRRQALRSGGQRQDPAWRPTARRRRCSRAPAGACSASRSTLPATWSLPTPYVGLLRIAPDGKVSVPSTGSAANRSATPMRWSSRATGGIYFSDASTRFGPADWGGTFEASVLDIIEQSATGRILVHDPASGKTEVARAVVRQWRGAVAGRALALRRRDRPLPDRKIAADAAASTWLAVHRRRRRPARQPARLPRQPDARPGRPHLGRPDPAARWWTAWPASPWLREVTPRLPRSFWLVPPAYGMFAVHRGRPRRRRPAGTPSGAYPETTAITETADRLACRACTPRGWDGRPRRSPPTIRAIAPDEVEAARALLRANGWERGGHARAEFERPLARSQVAPVAIGDDGHVIGFLRADRRK